MRLLEKDAAKRLDSAREVSDALCTIGRRMATDLRPPIEALTAPAVRRGAWQRRWTVVGLLAVFLVGVITVVIGTQSKDGRQVRTDIPPDSKPIPDAGSPPTTGVCSAGTFPPLDSAWQEKVRALPAEAQVRAVAAELKRRNPKFDAEVTPIIEEGKVVAATLHTNAVTDLTPLRAFPHLINLGCFGSAVGKGQLVSLEPLRGLPLTNLKVWSNPRLADLRPLAGMPLVELNCNATGVADLSPLRSTTLVELHTAGTQIQSLEPLRGLLLQGLNIDNTAVKSLAPLKGMKLRYLYCGNTQVDDLSPLAGMPITRLACFLTPLTDLSTVRTMPLEAIACDPRRGPMHASCGNYRSCNRSTNSRRRPSGRNLMRPSGTGQADRDRLSPCRRVWSGWQSSRRGRGLQPVQSVWGPTCPDGWGHQKARRGSRTSVVGSEPSRWPRRAPEGARARMPLPGRQYQFSRHSPAVNRTQFVFRSPAGTHGRNWTQLPGSSQIE
jgi:hypothetical protein